MPTFLSLSLSLSLRFIFHSTVALFPYFTWSKSTKRYQFVQYLAQKIMFRTRVSDSKEMTTGRFIVEKGFVYEKETHLTVMKTSLFFAGDGFAVYDSNGQVVFRVDSYGPDNRDAGELVLMDSSGRCLLTVRRKRPSLHQRWEGFLGERMEGDKPIFSVKRSSIIGKSNMTVEMFGDRSEEYHIEGCFSQRNCTIYDSSKETMAEIRRKVDASTNVMLGKDVFLLTLKPGFDGAFAMGLVLVLDQINGDDGGVDLDTTVEDCSLSS